MYLVTFYVDSVIKNYYAVANITMSLYHGFNGFTIVRPLLPGESLLNFVSDLRLSVLSKRCYTFELFLACQSVLIVHNFKGLLWWNGLNLSWILKSCMGKFKTEKVITQDIFQNLHYKKKSNSNRVFLIFELTLKPRKIIIK